MKKGIASPPEESSSIEEYLRQRKHEVDRFLDQFLPSAQSYPKKLHQAMRYSVFAGGKRIRPILAMATGEVLKGDFHQLIHLACALEMIHTYSLIHDDLPAMDDDDYRRGVLSVHKKFGEAVAILVGDGLLTLAFHLLGKIPGGPASAEAKMVVIHELSRAIGTSRGMIAGQFVDLSTQGKAFTPEQLEYIHSCKTGALIRVSVYCACILSKAPDEVSRRLSAFGSSVGLAFQIIDDILDVEGSSQELGKASGKDDVLRKATYPTLYGLEESKEIAAELVDRAIREISFLGSRGKVLIELARFISVRRF